MRTTFSRFGLDLPDHLRAALDRYAKSGRPPGSFLRACLENDLSAAVFRADEINQPLIPVVAAYLYRFFPSKSHGSKANVADWIRRGADARELGVPFDGGLVCDGCNPEQFCPVHSVAAEVV